MSLSPIFAEWNKNKVTEGMQQVGINNTEQLCSAHTQRNSRPFTINHIFFFSLYLMKVDIVRFFVLLHLLWLLHRCCALHWERQHDARACPEAFPGDSSAI